MMIIIKQIVVISLISFVTEAKSDPLSFSIKEIFTAFRPLSLTTSSRQRKCDEENVKNHQSTSFAYDCVSRFRGGSTQENDIVTRPYLPHTLTIRDSFMIAHSFHDHPSFGPAGGLHGATYTVDVEFASASLHPTCNWVIDIGVASDLVADVLKEYNYKNLDEIFEKDTMTTTEFMCKIVFEGVKKKLRERCTQAKEEEENNFRGWIKVTLWESHKAWGSYEGPSF